MWNRSCVDAFKVWVWSMLVHGSVHAARLNGGVPKYASISGYMRDTLHWLPIRQRIFYSAGVARSSRHCPSLLAGTLSSYIDPGCRQRFDPLLVANY